MLRNFLFFNNDDRKTATATRVMLMLRGVILELTFAIKSTSNQQKYF